MAEATVRASATGNVATRLAGMLGPPDWAKRDEMLDKLPPGIPILPPTEAGNFAQYRNKPNHIYAKDEAWQKCGALMEKYDAELCKAHREEIDTLLVFAGLFSAVVTGFTIESYQWLQNDPNDAIVSILSQIAHSVTPNGTATTATQSSSGMPRSVSVRINTYWFVSLTLSLSTALLAILGKQWIREYERHAPMPPNDYVGVRQVKFEGIVYWKVGDIISSLPLLLQLSLALFALGVLELLWNLDAALGLAVCIPVVLTLLFYVTTTLLPLFHFVYHRPSRDWRSRIPPCAYKSPQALFAMRAYSLATTSWWRLIDAASFAYRWLLRRLCAGLRELGILVNSTPEFIHNPRRRVEPRHTWAFWDKAFADGFDLRNVARLPRAYSRGLRWLVEDIDEPSMRDVVWNCLWDKVRDISAFEANLQGAGLRMDIEHPFGDQIPFMQHLSPRLALAQILEKTRMREGFQSEILIQNFGEDLKPGAVVLFLRAFPLRLDRELIFAIVRLVSAYCRRHILEDLAEVFDAASTILTKCPDTYTCDALRSCIILGMLNWMRSRTFLRPMEVSASPTIGPTTAMVLSGIISRLHESFGPQPAGLNALPHVEELAVLVKAYCTIRGQRVTWPLAEDFNHSVIRPLSSSEKGTRVVPENGIRVVLELLKISVCGIIHDADEDADLSSPPPEARDEQRNSLRALPLPGRSVSPTVSATDILTPTDSEISPYWRGRHAARTSISGSADGPELGYSMTQNEPDSVPPPYAGKDDPTRVPRAEESLSTSGRPGSSVAPSWPPISLNVKSDTVPAHETLCATYNPGHATLDLERDSSMHARPDASWISTLSGGAFHGDGVVGNHDLAGGSEATVVVELPPISMSRARSHVAGRGHKQRGGGAGAAERMHRHSHSTASRRLLTHGNGTASLGQETENESAGGSMIR